MTASRPFNDSPNCRPTAWSIPQCPGHLGAPQTKRDRLTRAFARVRGVMRTRPDPAELGLVVAQSRIVGCLTVNGAGLSGPGQHRIGQSIAVGSDQRRASDQDSGQQDGEDAEKRQGRFWEGGEPFHIDPARRRRADLGSAGAS